jgi:hypothetical protein
MSNLTELNEKRKTLEAELKCLYKQINRLNAINAIADDANLSSSIRLWLSNRENVVYKTHGADGPHGKNSMRLRIDDMQLDVSMNLDATLLTYNASNFPELPKNYVDIWDLPDALIRDINVRRRFGIFDSVKKILKSNQVCLEEQWNILETEDCDFYFVVAYFLLKKVVNATLNVKAIETHQPLEIMS